MKNTRKAFSGRRLMALVLVLAMLVSFAPGGMMGLKAEAATVTGSHGGIGTKVADTSTVDDWKEFFSASSTDNAGGIWTDKSVFNSAGEFVSAVEEFTGDSALSIDEDNFLIALSALASTKSIEGYSYLPTDTMLVLDLSGSMKTSEAVDDMVDAANDAIEDLLNLNVYNRVGVIAYSGNDKFGNSDSNTATVILPLGRYSPNQRGEYLEDSWNNTTGVRVVSGVKDANGNTVRQNNKKAEGGTYIQNGLYKAWQQFKTVIDAGDTYIKSGPMAGTTRTPVMVLMSDGKATAATTSFNDVGTSNVGNGGSNNADISFLTQLTSTWVRDKMEQGYNEEPLFYTLGLMVQEDAVLDPAKNADVTRELWNRYKGLRAGQTMKVGIDGDDLDDATLAYQSPVFDAWDSTGYVDEYFSASNEQGLLEAFEDIVDHIIVQSMYYPTMVEGGDVHDGGHLEFTDYIGEYMEVKSIKGIQLGNKLYDGSKAAQLLINGSAGGVDNPTALGDNLVWAVRDRLGISDIGTVRTLIGDAFNAGQIAYNMSTGAFSNYIGWYGDNDGTFLEFWDGESTDVPAGAYTTNKSYLFLDAVGEGHRETDMLYASIQVRTVIAEGGWTNPYGVELPKGTTTVIGRLPASLIPMIHYDVELSGTNPEQPSGMEVEAATPSRLLYEVGLRDEVDLLDLAYTASGAQVGDKYVFYTNQWEHWADDTEQDAWKSNTNAYYEPSEENEHYYFSENTPLYSSTNDTTPETSVEPGRTYYRRQLVYTLNGNRVDAKWKYHEVSSAALEEENLVTIDGVVYIKKGTVHRYVGEFETAKVENETNTVGYSDHPFVHMPDDSHEGYHIDDILGNNGKLTLDAYEGIKISKTTDETITNRNQEYEFVITASDSTLSGICTLIIEEADGTRSAATTVAFANGVAKVSLKAGQSAYILGAALIGKTLTVTETEGETYEVKSVDSEDKTSATITVEEDTITGTTFVNTKRVSGDVVISKTVISTHPEHRTNKEFEFNVTLTAPEGVNLRSTYSGRKVTTTTTEGVTTTATEDVTVNVGAGGVVTIGADNLKLKHNESLTILGLPVGTVVTAVETDVEDDGFTSDQTNNTATATVAESETASVHFTNTYAADPSFPETKFNVTITKNLENGETWSGGEFTFRLQKLNRATGQYEFVQPVEGEDYETSITLDAFGQSAEVTEQFMNSFDTAGIHSYRIVEVIPNDPAEGIIYDPVMCYFSIVVEDPGTGRLKVTNVIKGADTEVELGELNATTGSLESADIAVDFNNKYQVNGAAEAQIHIDKAIRSADSQASIPASGFVFDLYNAIVDGETWTAGDRVTSSLATDLSGDTVISLIYDEQEQIGTHYYILKEQIPDDAAKISGVGYTDAEYKVKVDVGAVGSKYTISLEIIKPDGTTITAGQTEAPVTVEVPTVTLDSTVDPKTVTITAEEGAALYYVVNDGSAEYQAAEGNTVTLDVTGTDWSVSCYAVKDNTASKIVTATVNDDDTITTVEADNNVFEPTATGSTIAVAKIETGVDFTNTFTPTPATLAVPISGIKTLTGHTMGQNEFSYGLYAADEEWNIGSQLLTATNGNVSTANGNSYQNFHFADTVETSHLTFENSGVYRFIVKEQLPTNGEGNPVTTHNGITYDTSAFYVTVTVTGDATTGALSAQITSIQKNGTTDAPIAFTNTYSVTPVGATINGTKTLVSDLRSLNPNAFSFQLFKADADYAIQGDALQTVENGAATGNTAPFSFNVTLDGAGDYYYVVKEVVPSGVTAENPTRNGVTFDTSAKKVHIHVQDNGDGTLTPTVAVVEENNEPITVAAFTNYYTVAPVSVEISGTKLLTGADFDAIFTGETTFADLFSFELYSADASWNQGGKIGDSVSVKAGEVVTDAAGNQTAPFAFGELTYTRPGTFRYIVKEVAANADPLITYDPAVYRVEVNVTDNLDGTLRASKTITRVGSTVERNEISFHNDVNPAPLTAAGLRIGGKKNFTKPLSEGRFSFELYQTEVNDGVVTAVGEPILVATHQASAADTSASFEFAEIEDDPATPEDESTSYLTFSHTGTYHFVIKEQLPVVNGVPVTSYQGVTYDETEYVVTVEIGEEKINGRDTLIPRVTYTANGETGSIEFNNTYGTSPSGELIISGSKTLEGRDMTAGEFTFVLTEVDDEGNPVSGSEPETAENDNADDGEPGSFTFKAITYDEAGTYYYTIAENKGGTEENGILYSHTEYTVTVTVTDNDKGDLLITGVTVSNGETSSAVQKDEGLTNADISALLANSIKFTNEYTVSGTTGITIQGYKVLDGRDMNADEFEFTLTEITSATDTTPVTDGYTDSVKNAAAKKGEKSAFKFEEITYKVSDMGKHYYLIAENKGTNGGITYDPVQYVLTVDVMDNRAGGLKVEATLTDGTDTFEATGRDEAEAMMAIKLGFGNHYAITTDGTASITGTKTLEGATIAGNQFAFSLYNADADFKQGTKIETVKNGADGSVTFTKLTYKPTDIGTHYYVVVEDNGGKAGYTYDDSVWHVTVTVTDNGDGTLLTRTEMVEKGTTQAKKAFAFTNGYTAAADKVVSLSVKKTVKNVGTETMGLENFKFVLENQVDKSTIEAVTDKDGNAVFTLKFTAADAGKTFSYKLYEVNTGVANVTYSTAVHEVKLIVTVDAATNTLVVTAVTDGKAVDSVLASYENVYDYSKPEPVDPVVPDTGDHSKLALWGILLACSVLAIGALLIVPAYTKKGKYMK